MYLIPVNISVPNIALQDAEKYTIVLGTHHNNENDFRYYANIQSEEYIDGIYEPESWDRIKVGAGHGGVYTECGEI